MLIRSTWTLTTNQVAVLPRAYCLELVKELHKQLNLSVGGEAIPSVTFSGLVGRCSSSKEFLSFHPDEFYNLSLCGLDTKAAKAIASLELSNSLEFLGAKFSVINREDDTTSYEQLYNKLVADEPEAAREFFLEFITPTAFSQHHTHLPLPVPALMFRSWLERWNHFSPIYLGGDELVSYLSSTVKIKHHHLRTRNFQLQQGYTTGFIGEVILQLPSRVEPLLANVAHLLVNYASFAGTGVKTRLGMGQTLKEVRSK